MDFLDEYSVEQERFRIEVRAHLDAVLKQDPEPMLECDQTDSRRPGHSNNIRDALAAKRWIAPTLPTRWGGAGLTPAHEIVIRNELKKRGLGNVLDRGSRATIFALQVWGSEEQQKSFLPLIADGKISICSPDLNPTADPTMHMLNVKVTKDADDFVLDGSDTFSSPKIKPDYIWTLANIDRISNPQQPASIFLIPTTWPGVHISPVNHVVRTKNYLNISFDDARVPAHFLLGGQTDGWPITTASFISSQEDYGHPSDNVLEELSDYVRNTTMNGKSLSEDPLIQQLLVEGFINNQIIRLLHMRNRWMETTGHPLTYHKHQYEKILHESEEMLSTTTRSIVGVYALLDHKDPRAPKNGMFEIEQRQSLGKIDRGPIPDVEAAGMMKALGLTSPEQSKNPGHLPIGTDP